MERRIGLLVLITGMIFAVSGCNIGQSLATTETTTAETLPSAEEYESFRDGWVAEMDGYIKNLSIMMEADSALARMENGINSHDVVICEASKTEMQDIATRAADYDASASLARQQYASILDCLYYHHVLPDQSDYNLAQEENREWKFAFCDVDFDGKEEMVLNLMSARDGGLSKTIVYGYDETNGLYKELDVTPRVFFFDNGVLFVDEPQSGEWGDATYSPMDVFRYNSETDSYEQTDFYWAYNQNSDVFSWVDFPADQDDDGDGIVYYIHNHNTIVNKVEYDEFKQDLISDAYELELPWQQVSDENFRMWLAED